MNIYLIYDRKAENIQSFFTAQGNVEAIRGAVGAARQAGSVLGDYPGDFELRVVGTIDRRTCEIALLDVPEVLGSVENLLSAATPSKEN
jgi:hypothetical protein